MDTTIIDQMFLELSQITKAHTKKEIIMIEALEKLARLGNGELIGNSIGNDIAKSALIKIGYII